MNITVNKSEVFIATSGKGFDPQKPSWVFIHGSAMDHTVWAMINRYFTSIGHNVLAFDLPGHGRSGGKPLNKIKAMADWLKKVFDEVGLNKAIVAGHSMGALVSYDFAARYPDRCRGAVLLGFCLPMPVNQALLDLSEANDHRALEMIVDFGYAGNSKIGAGQSPGLWMTEGGLRLMEQARPGALFHDFTACNEYTPARYLYKKITCPVLFIAGEKDKMTPMRGLMPWLDRITYARLEAIPRCGHMMMIEKPNQVIKALKQFGRNIQKDAG